MAMKRNTSPTTMSTIKSLQSTILDLPPCCIEIHPADGRYAMIGTYNLEKQAEQNEPQEQESAEQDIDKRPQSRNGSLVLVELVQDEIKIIETVPTPSAILDIHFTKSADETYLLGAATSTGSIEIYTISRDATSAPIITHRNTLQFFAQDVLITAFNWHPNGKSLGMTLSDGQVYLGQTTPSDENNDTPSHHPITQHDLEAWTLAFLPDGSGILSGGDDCALRFIPLPTEPTALFKNRDDEPANASVMRSPWTDTKIHSAGITAILPIHVDTSNMLVITGSYDDHIRLISIPLTGRRQVLAEENLGGGVWRFKVLNTITASTGQVAEMTLLVSCMYAGARVVRLAKDGDEWGFEVLARFEEHESMNYGCDSLEGFDGEGKRTIISTSFYDRLVCVWKY